MSFRAIQHRVAELRDQFRGLNSDVDTFGQAVDELARRRAEVPVFLVGPDGRPIGGGSGQSGVRSPFSPTFGASTVGVLSAGGSVAKSGSAGSRSSAAPAAGASVAMGGRGSGHGGVAKSMGRTESLGIDIGAIASACEGIEPMSPWDPRGLVNAEGQVYESGDWILQRVVRLGRGAGGQNSLGLPLGSLAIRR